VKTAIPLLLVAALLGFVACGRYGPPLRAPQYREEAPPEGAARAEQEERDSDVDPGQEIEPQEDPSIGGGTSIDEEEVDEP
jgi:predicted small lipoprotein YifL